MSDVRARVLFVSAALLAFGAASPVHSEPAPVDPAWRELPTYARTLCEPGHSSIRHDLDLGGYRPLQGLRFAGARPDFVALRSNAHYTYSKDRYDSMPNGKPADGPSNLLDTAGWRCSGTSEQTGCYSYGDSAAIPDAARNAADSLGPLFFVVRRDSHLTTVATWRALNDLLGNVDTLQEAALHATLRGYRIRCGHSTGEKVVNGWRLTVERPRHDGGSSDLYALQVDEAGNIRVLINLLRPPKPLLPATVEH